MGEEGWEVGEEGSNAEWRWSKEEGRWAEEGGGERGRKSKMMEPGRLADSAKRDLADRESWTNRVAWAKSVSWAT